MKKEYDFSKLKELKNSYPGKKKERPHPENRRGATRLGAPSVNFLQETHLSYCLLAYGHRANNPAIVFDDVVI